MVAPSMPVIDTRPAQAARVADYLEKHPLATAKEIDAACDLGSVTKVLSEMRRMDYDIGRTWHLVSCADGEHTRRVRTYRLNSRPRTLQSDLFATE